MTDKFKKKKNHDMVNVVLGEGRVLAHSWEWDELPSILESLRRKRIAWSFVGQMNVKLYGLNLSNK